MTARDRLPNRRRNVTMTIEHAGHSYFVTFNDAPEPSELFLDGAKNGSDLEAEMRAGAVAASLALQYGCPLAVLAGAMNRDANGGPCSALARAIDEARAWHDR